MFARRAARRQSDGGQSIAPSPIDSVLIAGAITLPPGSIRSPSEGSPRQHQAFRSSSISVQTQNNATSES